ncbi:IclR family transcriptional regulator [Allopusillimonas ginsengisoli]|uniref:IclR family transcriptional regulator n=1 Tax=Allopusillimonas ginsengisoli TaxID=453575 RepID=UPI0010C23E00|nr:MarR family transcriptional regulator [Allopusillimonas ginsengisoli]
MSRKAPATKAAADKPASPAGVTALERGLKLLRVLADHENVSLTELAKKSDLSKATALRLLRTLEQQGFVWRDGRQSYWLGYSLLVITRNLSLKGWLANSIQPELEMLAEKTGETASFFSMSENQRLCVAAANGWRDVGHRLNVGDTLPMTGASGEVFMSYSEGRPAQYEPLVSLSLGVRVAELASIAAPIFSSDGKLIGAVSLSGTRTRFAVKAYMDELRNHFMECLERIHASLQQ